MTFKHREDAAHQLLEKLIQYRGQQPLVLAIPRGSVNMAKIIANGLEGEFDVVLVRKLRSPYNPEVAIGAIDESGSTYIDDYAQGEYGGYSPANQTYLEQEKAEQLSVMRKRRALFSGAAAKPKLEGRIVIVVDDGLATGSTMIAALKTIRLQSPKELICAVPVALGDTLQKVARYADKMVCLSTPWALHSVGQAYYYFPQVSDEEVVNILAERNA